MPSFASRRARRRSSLVPEEAEPTPVADRRERVEDIVRATERSESLAVKRCDGSCAGCEWQWWAFHRVVHGAAVDMMLAR
ncbi:hypothetical protein BCR44DRAFT_1435635 [Catenaria anguillulae PL171]|uniref:Uncharacterized protein n=1 Tax=Catenaria anguillulae PL171 TaxID=765915 RepID=A0A1Y2HL47_9FUNG|nr:hypothetical protein BCR44DRAFT_1435635 [Catenaria anguillulae PL171]